MLNRPTARQQQPNTPTLFRTIFTQDQQLRADHLTLIPNHLTLTVFDHGHGLHPKPGAFIRYKQISYLQKQMQFLKQETIEIPFQRGLLIPALQVALEFLRQGSRVRMWTSAVLAYGGTLNENIPIQSNLVFDVQVYAISEVPQQLHTSKQVLLFFEEILRESREADQWVRKGKFQEALGAYEAAVGKFLAANLKEGNERPNGLQFLVSHQEKLEIDHSKEPVIAESQSIDISKITIKIQNICFKYLQLCYSVGQYLKVITTIPKIYGKLNIENNRRIQHVLVLTYLKLQETKLASKHFNNLKSQKDVKPQVIQKLAHQIQKHTKG